MFLINLSVFALFYSTRLSPLLYSAIHISYFLPLFSNTYFILYILSLLLPSAHFYTFFSAVVRAFSQKFGVTQPTHSIGSIHSHNTFIVHMSQIPGRSRSKTSTALTASHNLLHPGSSTLSPQQHVSTLFYLLRTLGRVEMYSWRAA